MSLLITAGIVATGLGAFIAGFVVAAVSGCVLLQSARVRRRGRRLAGQGPSLAAPRWATAWRRWGLDGSLPRLSTRAAPRRSGTAGVFGASDAMHRSS